MNKQIRDFKLRFDFFKVIPSWVINIFLIVIILIISYFTYFHNYSNPQAFFWDENYFFADAQKYLNNIFFMHFHPPFGKILIALGEKLIQANELNDQFINVEYAPELPKNFSFTGYRFFPVLCAWLTAPLLFGVFYLLVKNNIIAFLLSSLYIFDNALIVHFRGAMADSILIFFIVLVILLFLLLPTWQEKARPFIYGSIFMGVNLGLLATTKTTGLIVIPLFITMIFPLLPHWKKYLIFLGLSFFGFCITFVMIWQLHFTIADQINPQLLNNGYYETSPEYKEILAQKKNNSLLSFPIMFRDSLKYAYNYTQGVSQLDLCKVGENGSPPFFWLVGARSINYRWETPDSQKYKYLYLQANPVVWLIGLLGVILGTGLWLISFLIPLQEPLKNRFLLTNFLILYWGYMIAVSTIPRVMYLYHYFPPLIFSFCLFALVFREIKFIGKWRLTDRKKQILLVFLVTCIFLSYRFYSPLTYYQFINDEQFKKRMIFPLWELRCVNCEKKSPLAIPKSQ